MEHKPEFFNESRADGRPKIAPVQGYPAGIPWSMHLRAYEAYCRRYSEQPALIDLDGRRCRGGFGTGELDEFIPGWRDELAAQSLILRDARRFRKLIEMNDADALSVTEDMNSGRFMGSDDLIATLDAEIAKEATT